MEPHLEKLVAEHWTSVQAFIGFATTIMVGASVIAMTRGGLPSLVRWNQEIEKDARANAHARISAAMADLASGKGQHEACDNLIAGFDQWRELQERHKSRARRIARVPYVILLTLFSTGAAYVCWYLFETSGHKSSATCVSFVTILSIIAIYDWIPLFYLAYRTGILPEKSEKTEKSEKKP